ncbi:MAG: hypothetical protein H6706_18445 [Myxococcales bacterium]|nr:hypothetical protein [Myxococcales bacterium]
MLAAGPALAQFQQPAKATTGGGGESEGGGIQHFSATGVGMAVGTGAGGGVTARHGFLVGAAGRARDEEPPVIDPVPPDLRVSTARDRCEATVRFPAVRVTDNRDRIPQVTVTLLTDPPQNLDPAGDEVDLPIGSYDVIIVARDRAGNQVRETYRVDVVDEAAPIFRMVPDPTPIGGEIEAQGPAGTAVDVAFECVDACDPDPVGSVAPRLARYPVGDTELTATCRDGEGNEASEPVVIRVRDTIGPAVAAVPAPIEVECQSAQGATFQVPRVVWADNGTPANQLVQRMVLNPDGANQAFAPPPDELQLPRGVHVLRFFATDAAGNVGQTDVSVEVTDNGVPNVRVVQAPGQNGWTNADGDVQVVLEVADGCAADNGALQLDIGPPPDNIVRNGNRVTLTYSRDGIYPLAIEVTDEDGNVTRENSIAFGIDRTAPQPIFRAPGQGAVDAADEDTYPIYAQAEVLPIDFGGEDAGDGPTAGVRQVTVVYDPDGAARTLASQVFDGNGNPPRGDRLVAGIGCLNPFVVVGGVQRRDGYCNEDGELDLRYLDPGVHTIEVVVTDFAGNQGRGRAHFITADLHAGTERIIDRLTALRPIIGDALFARLVPTIQSLGRARDASDRRIAGSAFDSPVFLGSALRAAQTATNQLAAVAPQLPAGVQGELDLLQELLQRVSRSDVVLLQAHVESRPPPAVWPQYLRNAQSTDLDFADRFIGSVDDNIDAEAWSDAAGNVQSAYFHVKSALEGWVMDYHFFPNHGVPNDIQREYERGHTLLVSIAAEMDAYINEGLAGADTMRDIRRSLATVINALDILIQDGFDPDGGGMGLSDQRYVEELLELRSVANRTTLAGQNGVWVRNYQWSMMQVVRFMTQSSVEDAIFTRGGGRQIWPIYQRAHELIETGVDMLDDRRIQAVIDLYGREEDSHCLLYAVYHCDFLDDEGDADLDQPIPAADIPDYCWASMLRPVEWAGAAPVGNTPPQCLWADQVQR